MKKYPIKELAEIINAKPFLFDGFISSVSTDSRNIKTGDCFFAIQGQNFDGHDYVEKAINEGASCAVIKKDRASSIEYQASSNVLEVEDPIKALGKLAAHYRKECNFKVIAITGSVGKTTTRHIATHVLSSKYKVHQSPKSFNNEIGLPLTLLGAEPDTDMIVAEIGTNKPGEIASLSNIAVPDIAIITNIYPSHLEGFGCIQNIIEEKLSITQGLKPQGEFFINSDFPNLVKTANSKGCVFNTFSCDNISFRSPLPGKGNLENITAAWALCKEFGISKEQFTESLQNLPSVPMRLEIKQFGQITVIDDCYNANPASMKNALEILSSYKKGRLVFICGDMLELGDESEKLHKVLAVDIEKANVNLLLTVGPLAKITARFVSDQIQTEVFKDTDDAYNNLDKFIKDNDIVLVKGSRSIGLEMLVDKLKELFDKRSLTGAKTN